jgi:hypothetical protein
VRTGTPGLGWIARAVGASRGLLSRSRNRADSGDAYPTGTEIFEWVKNKTTEGDRELARGRPRDALAYYSQAANYLRQIVDELERAAPDPPRGGTSIFLQLLVAMDYLTVVLSRIANAHRTDGKPILEREAWEEMAVRLERVLPHAGGETKERFLSKLEDAREHLNS